MTSPDEDGGTGPVCNCPDISRMRPGQVFGTKPLCPIHDTPERMAMLASIDMVKAPNRRGLSFMPVKPCDEEGGI